MIESTTNRALESDAERDGLAFGVKQGHAYPAESQEAYVEGYRAACEGAGSIPSEAELRDKCEAAGVDMDEEIALRQEARVSEALQRLMPVFEKAITGIVFTAAKAGEVRADMSALRAALAVPSEGTTLDVDHIMGLVYEYASIISANEGGPRALEIDAELRAALAASDESLSRQSSEAAESLRSTRNTQGSGS